MPVTASSSTGASRVRSPVPPSVASACVAGAPTVAPSVPAARATAPIAAMSSPKKGRAAATDQVGSAAAPPARSPAVPSRARLALTSGSAPPAAAATAARASPAAA